VALKRSKMKEKTQQETRDCFKHVCLGLRNLKKDATPTQLVGIAIIKQHMDKLWDVLGMNK